MANANPGIGGKESRASSHARTTVVYGDNISEAKVVTHLVLLMLAGERRKASRVILTAQPVDPGLSTSSPYLHDLEDNEGLHP